MLVCHCFGHAVLRVRGTIMTWNDVRTFHPVDYAHGPLLGLYRLQQTAFPPQEVVLSLCIGGGLPLLSSPRCTF